MTPELDWPAIGVEAVHHFKTLLRFRTVNPPGDERPAVDFLASVLDREGIPFAVREGAPGRASLVARLVGSGKSRPVLLNGHLDVVGVEEARWTHPPFEGLEADGCIWGRGAVDMKNMVAMSLMTLLLLKRNNIPLDRDVIFAAVADEETGSKQGALHLVTHHPELVSAEYVLGEVGGHTMHFGGSRFYPIQVSEKGYCWFEMAATGEDGHGSMPCAHNAIVRLGQALDALARSSLPLHRTPIVDAFVRTIAEHSKAPERMILPLVLQPQLASFLLTRLTDRAPAHAAGLRALLHNTATPTGLSAGTAFNVIPSRATARIDGRILPGQSVDAFLEEIQQIVGRDISLSVVDHQAGTVFPSETPLYSVLRRTVERLDPGAVVVPYMIPGFTDAFAYARLGAICYGFSPVRLGPAFDFARMYHGHDERIPVEGFQWGVRVLFEAVRDFCAAQP